MRFYLIAVLACAGCYTTNIEGVGEVGWRTEMYTTFHDVPAKAHPQTPEEWQAKANSECADILVSARLPDTNLAWKHSRQNTGCLFSFTNNQCVCTGPPNLGRRNIPTHARFSIMDKVLTIILD